LNTSCDPPPKISPYYILFDILKHFYSSFAEGENVSGPSGHELARTC